ncbi:MAG: DUF1669 domain-containing protein [uncultured Thiotrichaceae bacterium]|uniref:phospholipase D n=1 Tax=uncultured Thiotrichaceae bacterium TaxID=298394 RepID=A0A6S6SSI8_9GAMM|nr:MAG: DUF1669 domain-containing protein [uncultured Thiotrichaceae bacterium]
MKIIPIILFLFLTACGAGVDQATENKSIDGISVYFTDASAPGAENYTGGPENQLIASIQKAENSIDVALYELSLQNLTDSLISAHNRGVHVRVLTDTDQLDWERFIELAYNGIEVKGDQRSALMHNKFFVIDGEVVWTGSMNMTYTGAYRNRENLVRLDSFQAAVNYTEEFTQLWAGTHNQENAADNYFLINNTPVDIHFSPDDNFRGTRLQPLLQQAQHSVHMLAFSFTSVDIAAELLLLKLKGVDVKIVVDSSQTGHSSSQYDDLLALGIDIRRDGQSHKLHHKVIIVDERYVLTGSYNFSENAESRNDENSVIIDSPALAQQFEQEFADIYSHASARSAPQNKMMTVDDRY